MSENGRGTKHHLENLKILLSQENKSEDLAVALGNCFVDVMERMDKREAKQDQIDTVLFGNEKLGVKGLVNEIKPILLFYRRIVTVFAFCITVFTAYKTGVWDWFKALINK